MGPDGKIMYINYELSSGFLEVGHMGLLGVYVLARYPGYHLLRQLLQLYHVGLLLADW